VCRVPAASDCGGEVHGPAGNTDVHQQAVGPPWVMDSTELGAERLECSTPETLYGRCTRGGKVFPLPLPASRCFRKGPRSFVELLECLM
jgi:hypothetical protein